MINDKEMSIEIEKGFENFLSMHLVNSNCKGFSKSLAINKECIINISEIHAKDKNSKLSNLHGWN